MAVAGRACTFALAKNARGAKDVLLDRHPPRLIGEGAAVCETMSSITDAGEVSPRKGSICYPPTKQAMQQKYS